MRPYRVLYFKHFLDYWVLRRWWVQICEVNTEFACKGSAEGFLNRWHCDKVNLAEIHRPKGQSLETLVTGRIATALVVDPSVPFWCVYQQMLAVLVVLEPATACEDVQKPHAVRFYQKFVRLLLRETQYKVVLVFCLDEESGITERPCGCLTATG